MGQIVPRSILTQAQITTKLTSLADEVLALAAYETNTKKEEWVVRDILPLEDLSYFDERWVNQHLFTVVNVFEQDLVPAVALPVDKYLVFYGVVQNPVNPTIYGICFRQGIPGRTTIDTIQFRKLLEEQVVVGYFDRIIYRPQSVPNIQLIANALTAQYAEEFEILGMCCEKYGNIVSGPKTIV
jgi:hypothetical protein